MTSQQQVGRLALAQYAADRLWTAAAWIALAVVAWLYGRPLLQAAGLV